jgi:hypothetical protein
VQAGTAISQLAVSLVVAIVDDAVDAAVIGSWLNLLAAILLLSAALPSIVIAVRNGGVVED